MDGHYIPTVRDELNRKSIDAVEYLVKKHVGGEISDEAYSVALDTLFIAVSGIVREDFIDLITAAGDEVKKPEQKKTANTEGSW